MNIKIFSGLLFLGLFFIQPMVKAEVARLDRIVATVNTEVITEKELDKRIALMKRQFGENAPANLRQKALDDLIDISLQLQLAKRNGIKISDKELDAVVANIAKSHDITVAKLKEVLPEQEGMSFAEFRNQLREQGLLSRVQQQALSGELMVSEKDIAAILRNPPRESAMPVQYHVIDVLFGIKEDATEKQKSDISNEAQKVAVKLRNKDSDVEAIVKEIQGNLGEGVKSEDLGWRRINEFPDLFAKEVAKMQVNQVVGPIQAPNGLHLLKLLAINGSSSASGKLTKDQAGEIAYRRKLAEKLGPWLKELREPAYIKISK